MRCIQEPYEWRRSRTVLCEVPGEVPGAYTTFRKPQGSICQCRAALYNLIETAKANDLEPYWYLRHILEKLPNASTEDDFCKLLPQNVPEK